MYDQTANEYGEQTSGRIPYMIFLVIENDTNNNEIFDESSEVNSDLRSLYLFDLKSKSLTKISPQKENVIGYSVQGYGTKYSSRKKTETSLSPLHYTVYFRAYDPDSGIIKKYLYHIEKSTLEPVENYLSEKYDPDLYKE